MSSAATVYVDLLARDEQFRQVLNQAAATMDSFKTVSGGISNTIGQITPVANNTANNLLKLNTVVNVLARSAGLSANQVYLLNLALTSISGNTNLLAAGGITRLTASMQNLLGLLAGMGPIGWGVTAFLAALAIAFKFAGDEAKKTEERIKRAREAFDEYMKIGGSIEKSIYGGSRNRFGDYNELAKTATEAREQLDKAYREGTMQREDASSVIREKEIADMEKLSNIYLDYSIAINTAKDKLDKLEESGKDKGSNQYLTEKIEILEDMIKVSETAGKGIEAVAGAGSARYEQMKNNIHQLKMELLEAQKQLSEVKDPAAEMRKKFNDEFDKLRNEYDILTADKERKTYVKARQEGFDENSAEALQSWATKIELEKQRQAEVQKELEKTNSEYEQVKETIKSVSEQIDILNGKSEIDIKIAHLQDMIASGKLLENQVEDVKKLIALYRQMGAIQAENRRREREDEQRSNYRKELMDDEERYNLKIIELEAARRKGLIDEVGYEKLKLKYRIEYNQVSKFAIEGAEEMYNRIQSSIGAFGRVGKKDNTNNKIEENTRRSAQANERLTQFILGGGYARNFRTENDKGGLE